jgi:hypothetical protein
MEWEEPGDDNLGKFIREHLLPRLTNLEEEVRLLRKVAWPVCQALTERWSTDDISSKWKLLSNLDPDDALDLVNKKHLAKRALANKGINVMYGSVKDEWASIAEFGNSSGVIPTHVLDEVIKGKVGGPSNGTNSSRIAKESVHLTRTVERGINTDSDLSTN